MASVGFRQVRKWDDGVDLTIVVESEIKVTSGYRREQICESAKRTCMNGTSSIQKVQASFCRALSEAKTLDIKKWGPPSLDAAGKMRRRPAPAKNHHSDRR